jgi:hypothetical protein
MTLLAGLAGLVLAVLIALAIEMFRPTIPGQRRVARRLGVPLLGWADRRDSELADLGRRIRLAAKRADVDRVTLVGTGGAVPPELASRIAAAVYGDTTKLVSASPAKPPKAGSAKPGTAGPDAAKAEKAKIKDAEADAAKARDTAEESPADADRPETATGGNPNSKGPSRSRSDVSVVRAGGRGPGTAVMSARTGEVAAQPSGGLTPSTAPSPSEITQPIPARAVCHVHAFEDIDPGSDDDAAVVAVVGPVTTAAGMDSVRDLVAASGWPLLGVVATTQKIRRIKG